MSVQRVIGSAIDTDGKTIIHWQHRVGGLPQFDERVFEDQWLFEQDYVVDSPAAGRGAALFLNIDQQQLVLRHYRRGGFVRNFSEKNYVWHGLERTRAWQEFDVLCFLEQQDLPAPKPYACQVKRTGLTYSATLITHFLNGRTLAERMCSSELGSKVWQAVGECISLFHVAGVHHADLNAHNVLVSDDGVVSLIDFDRATVSSKCEPNMGNIDRLQRSLTKIDGSGPAHFSEKCWESLLVGYHHRFM